MHRILFRPSFLAEIRDHGWDAASADVRGRCIELAPKPGFDIDLDVPGDRDGLRACSAASSRSSRGGA